MAASRSPESTTSIAIVGPLDGHACRHLGCAQRQLDAQDAVVVARLRALCDDLRAQLDHAAEGTGLDLELLVHPALRLLHRALPAEDELAPGDLQADRLGVDAGKVDQH